MCTGVWWEWVGFGYDRDEGRWGVYGCLGGMGRFWIR